MNYTTFLTKITSKPELENLQYKNLSDEQLFDTLIDNEIIFVSDWRGDGDGDLLRFFNSRTRVLLQAELPLTQEDLYQKFEKQQQKQSAEEFMPFALKYFNKHLKKLDCAVVIFDMGNDSYHLSVSSNKDVKNLNKINHDFWKPQSVTKYFASPEFILPFDFFSYYIYKCKNCGSLMAMSKKTGRKKGYYLCSSCGTQRTFYVVEGKSYTIYIPTSVSEYGEDPFTKIYVDDTVKQLIKHKPFFQSEDIETCDQIISDLLEMAKGKSVK